MDIGRLHVPDEWDRDEKVEVVFDLGPHDDAFDWLNREQVEQLHAHLGKLLEATEKKTSAEWHVGDTGYVIMDPDGWDRQNYEYSFSKEKVTRGEFDKRLGASTVLYL